MPTWIGAVLALVLAVPSLRADTLTGTVTGPTGAAVAGATIEVQGSILIGTTLASGVFTISLPAGIYNLQIVPPATLIAAPRIVTGVVVSGVTNIGVQSLPAGFTVTGTVLTAANVPIAGGDIDVFDLATGIKLVTPGDTTNATGGFSIILPAGTYRFRAEPVVGTLFVAQSQILTISASITLPAIHLPVGVILTGTVRSSAAGNPALVDVDIDVDDLATGQRIETPVDNTLANGVFSVVVPTGVYRVTFEPLPGALFVARQIFGVTVAGTTNMGNIYLDPGVAISGTVKGPGNVPVVGADIDARSSAGDVLHFNLNDQTGPTGAFSIVVLPGTYRVIVNPIPSQSLVAQSTGYMTFNVSTTLPQTTLQAGVVLSGVVTAFGGVPQQGCKIVINASSNGAHVETPNDATNAAGQYSVLVPVGNYTVSFVTRKYSIAQDAVVPGVAVNGATVLNRSLNLVPMFVGIDDPADPEPQTVVTGNSLYATIIIYNPTAFTSGALVTIDIVDPYGTSIPLVANSPILLGTQNYVLGQIVPIPLPFLAPANHGLPHRFRIRLTDPMNGAELDQDSITFVPQ